jgi:hypothetical protein
LKIVAAISRFIHPPEPPTPVAPAPFDDGLVEIARLIAADDPVTVAGLADPPPR